MSAAPIHERLTELTTAHLADACVREGVAVRAAPAATTPTPPGSALRGPARPVRHYGSVDVFLEAIDRAEPGDVLVVDNGGRLDEACVGDLVAIEAQAAGLAGLVVWGLHRDTAELLQLGLPVLSLGTLPNGPLRLDSREPDAFESARIGDHVVTGDDWVQADADGVLFVAASELERVVPVAETIRNAERRQAAGVAGGLSLREQFAFSDYLAKAREDPSYTLRQHLVEIGGAIET